MATKKLKYQDLQVAVPNTKVKTIASTKNGLSQETKQTITKPTSLLGSWQKNTGIFLLLILGTLALYSSDLNLGFFSVDDEGYVINNPWIKSITVQNIVHIFSTPYFLNYSPLHLFSYMIDYAIAGLNPYAFHLSSNLWAGIVAGFVYLTALAFTQNRLASVIAAVLFVVHPAHVEAVAWISSRKDLVAAAFALPSLICYLQYRKEESKKWYVLSLGLFLCALLGKVSVATFPAVFLAYDLFIQKRPLRSSLLDKIPYLIITAFIAFIAYKAQPLSGNNPSPYVFLNALLQSLWLLTGFGNYVVYRLRPEDVSATWEIGGTVIMLALFVAPWFLGKKMPLIAVLCYWVLFGLLPAQFLSFVHPVTDRYLFFPSIGIVILLAIAIVKIWGKINVKAIIPTVAFSLVFTFLWAKATLNYLDEWNDPRSLWFAAMNKSVDPDIPYSLGGYYVDVAGRLGANPRGSKLRKEKIEQIANAIWSDDKRLPGLLSEWNNGQQNGPMEKEFQNYLWTQAWNNFELALQTKGIHVFPNLFYKRGLLLLDKGDLEGAKKEFLNASEETSLSSVKEIREELSVNTHFALGVIAWRQNNYKEAFKWYKMAEEEQNAFGGNWVPDASANRQKAQNMMNLLSGTSASNSNDPQVGYNLGLYYLEAADQLGKTPRSKFSLEAATQIAKEVWTNNSQLSTLKEEWNKGQHGSTIETLYQSQLRKKSWDAFEQAVKNKGNLVMPNLYFRRGMLLGETGNFAGSKKEFLTAITEAAKEQNSAIRQELTVLSHDALGVLAWTTKNYKEAFDWFKTAEEEQTKFGGHWVPNISSKRQQMEAMLTKTK